MSSLLSAQQAARAEAVEAFALRVGQQMTATILDMIDQHVLLDVAGRRLSATLETEQQLAPGQVVQLIAVDVQPEQITLRLVADEMLTGPPGQQALASAGLPDTPENRVALVALLAEGQPISAEAVQALRQVAASLGATTPEDVHAVSYLMARGLPLTVALLAVVREGQAAGRDLSGLEDQLRAKAGQLLGELADAAEDVHAAAPELRSLLAQLASASPASTGSPSGPQLQALIQQLTVSLEATLRGLVEQGSGGEAPAGDAGSDAQPFSAEHPEGAPAPQANTVTNPESGSQEGEGGSTTSQPQGTQALPVGAQPEAPAGQAPGTPQTAAGQLGEPAEPQPAASEPPRPQAGQSLPSPEPQSGTAPTSPAPGPAGPAWRGPAGTAQAGETETAPAAHELARRAIPALDRALQSGALSGAAQTSAAELRHTAERLVQAVQFQQMQTILQPTPAEPYVLFSLPMPEGHGEGELQLFVRDEGGSPKIDPNDARLVIDLRLSQLRRVSIVVHVYQRQLYCHMEAESLQTQRLLESAAAELQDSLRGLGYAVDPIHCTMAGSARRGTTSQATLQLAKLGRLNVTA